MPSIRALAFIASIKAFAATRVVPSQCRGGAGFSDDIRGNVQHVGAAQARAHREARARALSLSTSSMVTVRVSVEALVAVQHHQRRHQLAMEAMDITRLALRSARSAGFGLATT